MQPADVLPLVLAAAAIWYGVRNVRRIVATLDERTCPWCSPGAECPRHYVRDWTDEAGA